MRLGRGAAMIRDAAMAISTLVFVFSVTFIAVHHLTSQPAQAPRLVAIPASDPAATDGPLRVSTLGRAAALPALRRAPAGASAALVAGSLSPSPPPATALRAKAAGG